MKNIIHFNKGGWLGTPRSWQLFVMQVRKDLNIDPDDDATLQLNNELKKFHGVFISTDYLPGFVIFKTESHKIWFLLSFNE